MGSNTGRPEILIVGAGPVGLTAAVELSRRGYDPDIIDDGDGSHVESRALAINPRSLDILALSGLTDKLLQAGQKVSAVNFRVPERVLFRLETRNIPHPRNYILVLPQAETEKILLDGLGGRKRVQWKTRLTDLELASDKPVVTLEKNGKRRKQTPDLVIGADGAHSTVRKSLGIGFAGSAYEHEWGLADVRVAGLEPGELHVFDLSPSLIGFIPIRDDLFRAVADRTDVLELVPDSLKIKSIEWESQFRISHRQVETYQRGAVFLAGDAAHIHSPLGGRGMNLGIEDAAWLAWLIERGETERYTEFRLPVAKKVIGQVDNATRFVTANDPARVFLRRRIVPHIAGRDFMQRRALKQLAGLAATPPPWLEGGAS
jgi:2-polyprenyl-6-methoxyphenol hydroxylase-like FAD-dependent oxidoreductase